MKCILSERLRVYIQVHNSWNNGLQVVRLVGVVKQWFTSHKVCELHIIRGTFRLSCLRTKNINPVLHFRAFTFSERRICVVLSMFVSPAIHGSYKLGKIAHHQYVNIYAVHQLYESWTIVSRPVQVIRVVQFVSSHSRVVSVRQYRTRMKSLKDRSNTHSIHMLNWSNANQTHIGSRLAWVQQILCSSLKVCFIIYKDKFYFQKQT